MPFIHKRTSAQFYNNSQMTFLVQKDCVDIIFKIRRGIYLTVSVHTLSEGRLLLSCDWGDFWNRLKSVRNTNDALKRLRKSCPLSANIFTNTVAPHFVFLKEDKRKGAVVVEMKAPVQTNNISDYLHEKVVQKAIELMDYNLNLFTELEERCPFSAWQQDIKSFIV